MKSVEVKITDDNKTLNSAREFEKRLNSGGTQTQNELAIRFKRNKAATAFNVVLEDQKTIMLNNSKWPIK